MLIRFLYMDNIYDIYLFNSVFVLQVLVLGNKKDLSQSLDEKELIEKM